MVISVLDLNEIVQFRLAIETLISEDIIKNGKENNKRIRWGLTNEFKDLKKLYDELNEKYERLEKKSEESKSAMFVMRFFQIRSI